MLCCRCGCGCRRPATISPASFDAQTQRRSTGAYWPMRSGIWYDGGNVNLQAQSMQLKVHKSVLAQSAQALRDMFSIPQPPRPPRSSLFSDHSFSSTMALWAPLPRMLPSSPHLDSRSRSRTWHRQVSRAAVRASSSKCRTTALRGLVCIRTQGPRREIREHTLPQ